VIPASDRRYILVNQADLLSTSIEVRAYVPEVLRRPLVDFDEFSNLYREHVNEIYAFVNYYARNHFEAEDLTADTFERALRYLRTYDRDKGTFRTWLFTIASNVVRHDRLRHARPQEYLDESNDREFEDRSSSSWSAIERGIQLKEALATLSERDAKLVALKFGAGLNNREIAAVMKVSESNVGTILARSLRKMGSVLQ